MNVVHLYSAVFILLVLIKSICAGDLHVTESSEPRICMSAQCMALDLNVYLY